MTVPEILAATFCALLLIGGLTIAGLVILKHTKAAPPPLDEQVRAIGARQAIVEAQATELAALVKRSMNRDAQARTRARKRGQEVEEDEQQDMEEDGPLLKGASSNGELSDEEFLREYPAGEHR